MGEFGRGGKRPIKKPAIGDGPSLESTRRRMVGGVKGSDSKMMFGTRLRKAHASFVMCCPEAMIPGSLAGHATGPTTSSSFEAIHYR
jgi:hypothetical protein